MGLNEVIRSWPVEKRLRIGFGGIIISSLGLFLTSLMEPDQPRQLNPAAGSAPAAAAATVPPSAALSAPAPAPAPETPAAPKSASG
eukprot:m.4718 g.4718  ORF g.4718 m.4718 type:complete len:86 (+) comp1934_c0_seq1:28-285(+)